MVNIHMEYSLPVAQGIYDPASGRTWRGASMLVCEYDPPGNVIDAQAYIQNVRRPIVPVAQCAASPQQGK